MKCEYCKKKIGWWQKMLGIIHGGMKYDPFTDRIRWVIYCSVTCAKADLGKNYEILSEVKKRGGGKGK